ncbi:tetratricopeptide repeat protein 19, mitochondrial [Centrocercus urophasianus]|uniref:tetratricopeptide repeat protein 19, mitochondrial n=1 Tax=Centrocercus urophasianus TaxID=9002 RepID=UPI001C64EF6B|nr:tetratricopeptide repeat protein 19, mitochondrial [Centrocercus urophasianus]
MATERAAPVTRRLPSRDEGELLKGPRPEKMLAAALPRALCRSAWRCPAGLARPRPVWHGRARQERGGNGGGAGFARWRWAPPGGAALAFLGAFSVFPRDDGEEDGEDAIILLLKKAKLSSMKGELDEADRLLHRALRLAQQADNRRAIIYTYSTMANVAFMQGQLDNAEKLYKATMSYLLAGDMKEDDNAILEMSLKLASIYAAQKQHKLALAGYEFCILTLEEKIAKQKDLPEDVLPAEEKANTRLLLGMSLDSYARYLLDINQLSVAQKMYEKALQISSEVQGETHPQTVVLMNDLATVLDAQGHYDEAYSHVKRAAELAKETQHPEEHMVLNNMAAILMHKKDFLQAKQVYKAALKQAEQKGDADSVRHIQEELAELAKRRKGSQ